MTPPSFTLRPAHPEDAPCIGVLAMYVFIDTYCRDGLRPDLAAEVMTNYLPEVFAARLRDPALRFVLAVQEDHLLGFAETAADATPPQPSLQGGLELVRLYVHPHSQRRGLGRALLRSAEEQAAAGRHPNLWLTAWTGNANALSFYAAQGYENVGATTYTFQDRTYENRIFTRALPGAS